MALPLNVKPCIQICLGSPFASAFPSFMAGQHLYESCESSILQRTVDIIADKLSSNINFAIEKISQPQLTTPE